MKKKWDILNMLIKVIGVTFLISCLFNGANLMNNVGVMEIRNIIFTISWIILSGVIGFNISGLRKYLFKDVKE